MSDSHTDRFVEAIHTTDLLNADTPADHSIADEKLRRENVKLRRLVRSLEWVSVEEDTGDYYAACPMCLGAMPTQAGAQKLRFAGIQVGHMNGCRVDRVLNPTEVDG